MMRGMTRFELINEASRRTADSAGDAIMVDLSTGVHDFGRCTRWLWTGSGGTVRMWMASGQEILLEQVPPTTMLPISITKVADDPNIAYAMIAFF